MATTPGENSVTSETPEANTKQPPSLDDALSGMTVDDALAGMDAQQLDPMRTALPGTVIGSPAESAMWGVAKAGFELKDFIFGEPNREDKWAVRQFIEDRAAGLRKNSGVNGVAESVTQFGVGFAGLGKIKYVAKGIEAAKNIGPVAHWAANTARGAAAGAIFMDPHEERLSNLVQSYPGLQNPITSYLAAKPEDSAAEGRLKNALEGVVMDAALSSALTLVAKSVRLFRSGDIKAANEAATAADKEFLRAADEDYQAKRFFDHEQMLAQRQLAAEQAAASQAESASAAEFKAASVDDQAGRTKNFLAAPTEADVPAGYEPRAGVAPLEGNAAALDKELAAGGEAPTAALTERPATMAEGGMASALDREMRAQGVDLESPRGQETGVNAGGSDAGGTSGSGGGDQFISGDLAPDARPADVGGGGSGLQERLYQATGEGAGTGAASGPQPRTTAAAQGADAGRSARRNDARGAGAAVSPEDVERSLARLRADNNALAKYGSREAAIDEGYRFKGGDDIPWQKLNTTEETQAWMGQLMDAQAAAVNAKRGGNARGVMTDKAVDRMIEQRAAMWNEDPAALRGELDAAGDRAPQLAAQMETSFVLANKAYQDAYELASRINNSNYTGFASREEALDALRKRMAFATSMYANAKAIASNSARALRRMRGEFQITDQQLANILESDPEGLLGVISATGGDPKLLAQAGRLTTWQAVRDNLGSLYAANFLWSWKSQVINFATSAAQIIWRPLETGVGSLGLQALGVVKGDAELIASARALRTQSLREVTYTAGMLQDGLQAALKAFLDGDSILVPHAQEHFNVTPGNVQDLREVFSRFKPMNSVDDVVSNTITLGLLGKAALTGDLRVLGAADEFVKTIRYRNVVAAKASVEADQRGLSGQAAKDFINTKLDAAFDDLGRGVDLDAVREAQASTFQNDYIGAGEGWFGTIGSGYANLVATTPVLRLITPFIKTPTNLIRYGIKLTPGLNMLQKQYARDMLGGAGPEAQARAMGQMALGSLLASSAAMLWANGRLTGSGPQDVDQKNQWLSQGNRPYSIVWQNEKGEKQYFELSRFDPVVMPLLLVADAMNMVAGGTLRDDEQQNIIQAVGLAFAHLVKDKTYLKNLSDALGAATDDKKMESFTRRFVPGLVPFSTLMSSVNPDPVLHELRHWYDGILARTPGFSASLPPKRDFLGDKIIAPQGFVSSQKNTPLTDALNEVYAVTGRYIEPPAAKSGNTGGVDLRDFTLKDGRSAYDRYQELAGHPPNMPPLKDRLLSIVQSEAYQRLPHGGPTESGTKLGLIMEKGIQPYREAAFKRLLVESPELRKAVMQRRLDLAKAVSTGAKSVQAAGQQGRMDYLNELTSRFGIQLPSLKLPTQ